MTSNIKPKSTFLDTELLQAFLSNTLATQIAAFHGVQFENGVWAKIKFIEDDVSGENTTIFYFVVDGEMTARHILYGIPSQAYERAAYLATTYAESNNTKVVVPNDFVVDQ